MIRSSIRRTYRQTDKIQRAMLEARSDGWCEAQLSSCTGRATDVCHRIARKAGGRPKGDDRRLSNTWHGCRACHRWATERPARAYELGLALKEHQDTEAEPIVRRGVSVLLFDDGTIAASPSNSSPVGAEGEVT
jgi:hypothetical protein